MPGRRPSASISPEFALLGFLAQRPAHGYDLHQRLVTELGEIWHIRLSQTYNILNRLETQGMIVARLQKQDKLPDRHIFELTPAGLKRFEDWLHTPTPCSVRAIRVEFTTRLYFARAGDPRLARELISKQTNTVEQGIARMEIALERCSTEQAFNRLGLQLRIAQLHIILDWLKQCEVTLGLVEV